MGGTCDVCVICNPAAARGGSAARFQHVQQLMEGRASFHFSRKPGHIEELAREAALAGCRTVVAASGNDGSATTRFYPAAIPYVVTVGATDRTGAVATFSTFGAPVNLVAPGTDIYSSYLEKGYAFSSGTSHAAPFVAGSAALLHALARRHGARLRDSQLKYLLRQTADRPGTRFRDRRAGFGQLNVADAARLLLHKMNGRR